MKLTDLDPRWFGFVGNDERLGVTFLCPCCRQERIGVAFHHLGHEAMDDSVIRAHHHVGNIWTITGDSFENLTISPSIDASHAGHWHGFIVNGEIK